MPAGVYRHRVRVEKPVYTQDAMMAPVKMWELVDVTWASIRPLRGREYFAAKSVNSEVETTIRMRPREIENDWRVVYQNRVFGILAVLNRHERNIELELMCKEVEHDG